MLLTLEAIGAFAAGRCSAEECDSPLAAMAARSQIVRGACMEVEKKLTAAIAMGTLGGTGGKEGEKAGARRGNDAARGIGGGGNPQGRSSEEKGEFDMFDFEPPTVSDFQARERTPLGCARAARAHVGPTLVY